MKVPKNMRKHCPTCNKHTQQLVKNATKGKTRPNSAGQRRYVEKSKGFRGQTKPIQHNKAKITKKIQLALQCSVCSKKQNLKYKRVKTCLIK
ncbi:MAG: hypothetical protein MHMPM18_004270 [Marteilia pararefringens]